MPVYLYRNLTTGETFEVEQRITESALSVHPTTGDPVKRLIQPVGIAFKGSGFYVTDSRGSGSRAGSSAEGRQEGTAADGAAPGGTGDGGAGASAGGEKGTAPATPTPPPTTGGAKGAAAASD